MGYAKLDMHRKVRSGFAEVIYCAGKADEHLLHIFEHLYKADGQVFGTRATQHQYEILREKYPQVEYDSISHIIKIEKKDKEHIGNIAVCTAGTADIAVISLGGTVVNTSIKVAGDDFDEAIVRYMKKKHNLLIGERTAEDIKIKVGSAYPRTEIATMNVRGRNLVTGLPKTVEVTSEETQEALKEATSQIVEAVHSVLEKTPPELASDIADRGIVLTGGGSLLQGLEELIESKTGIHTMTAEDPMTAVAIGTGKFIEFLAGYRDDK